MSLDVYFGRDPAPAEAELRAYLREQPHVAIHEENDVTQALYENAATRVYFIFDVGDSLVDDADLDANFERDSYDVFVPSLMLMHDRETNVVLRTVAWPEAIPIVMPPADASVVRRQTGRRFFGRTEDGIGDADAVFSAVGPHVRPLEDDLRVLPPEEAESEAVCSALAALQLRPLDPKRDEAVAPDGFVDVRAEAA